MTIVNPKKMLIILVCILAATGLVASSYWYYEHVWNLQIHWHSASKVNFTPTGFDKTQRLEPQISTLAHKKVIAIVFIRSTRIYGIVTEPGMIRRIVEGLLKVERIKGGRLLGGIDLDVIFEDYTRMEFPFEFDSKANMLKGINWNSQELYPVVKSVFKKFLGDTFEPL